MKVYKGFNKDMTCTPNGKRFQFEERKTYEELEANLCKSGFHACEAPLDVFGYYAPAESVYHKCELDGVSPERKEDSKVCGTKITVGAEIGIPGLVNAHVEWVKIKFQKEKKKRTPDTCLPQASLDQRALQWLSDMIARQKDLLGVSLFLGTMKKQDLKFILLMLFQKSRRRKHPTRHMVQVCWRTVC